MSLSFSPVEKKLGVSEPGSPVAAVGAHTPTKVSDKAQ